MSDVVPEQSPTVMSNPYDPPTAPTMGVVNRSTLPLALAKVGFGGLVYGVCWTIVTAIGTLVLLSTAGAVGLWLGLIVGTVVGVGLMIRTALGVARTVRPTLAPIGTSGVVLLGLMTTFVGWFGACVALFSSIGAGHGRQLRRWRRLLLPRLATRDDWSRRPVSAPLATEEHHVLADQWRESGRLEHASVAAFSRLTLDLIALGAPPKLIEDANSDARDEIRHAQICFSIARALDGRSLGPAPFPEVHRAGALPTHRPLALAKLALDALIDGGLQEGLSARVLVQLVKRCENEDLRDILRGMAADEGRHAAHGWDVVEWCLAEGGTPIAQALLNALPRLPKRTEAEPRSARFEAYGIPSSALETDEMGKTHADAVRRVRSLVEPMLSLRAA